MLRILKQYYPVRNAVFVVGEGLFIFLSVILASWIIIGDDFLLTDKILVLKILLIVSVCQLCLYYNDLYDLKITDTKTELFIRLLQALGASAIMLAPVYFLFPVCIIGNGIFNTSIFFIILNHRTKFMDHVGSAIFTHTLLRKYHRPLRIQLDQDGHQYQYRPQQDKNDHREH